MPIPQDDFLEKLDNILEQARVLSRNEPPEKAFSLLTYYLSIEIIPLLMEQLSANTVPAPLLNFMERYYLAAKGVNNEIFTQWKENNPLAPFQSKRQLKNYRVPPE